MDALRSALTHPELLACLQRHRGQDAVSAFGAHFARLSKGRFVVPVAGVQGSGKSTLLNAIAFDQPVLPVEADETTCVPVEIGFSPQPSGNATIKFQNGSSQHVPATDDSLAAFVDNAHNPGNRLGVERVILESKSPTLANGLVLVDLPGVGSLTQANMETTKRYLDESVGVLFMLRTVPPLTRSESIFVAASWARLRAAFFVQNRWTDETDEEATGGREHNQLVLRDIAKRAHIPLENAPTIHVVTAYNALKGRLAKNQGLIGTSGLATFEGFLESASREWPRFVESATHAAALTELEAAKEVVDRQLADLHTERAGLEKQLHAEDERFANYLEALGARCNEGLERASSFQREQTSLLNTWVQNVRTDLRNEMRSKLRSGIVDGPRLTRALNDEETDKLDEVFSKLQESILVFQDEIRESFKDFSAWKPQRIASQSTVNRPESTKYEVLIPKVVGAGAGLGGMAGGAWATAKLGAAIGTTFGPVGTAIGAAVGGILGGIAGFWLGRKAQNAVTDHRAKLAEAEVFQAIDTFAENTRKGLREEVDKVHKEIRKVLEDWKAEQRTAFESDRSKVLETLGQTKEQRAARATQLEPDSALFAAWIARLGGKE